MSLTGAESNDADANIGGLENRGAVITCVDDGPAAHSAATVAASLLRPAIPPPFAMATRRLRAGAVLWVRGEIDIATGLQLEREATRLLEHCVGRIVIDLSDTTFMDLSGVRLIDRLARRASELGGSLVLAEVPPQIRRLLDLVSLTRSR